MSDPVFATKWDFLFARVLVGIDRSSGVWSGSEPAPGQQMVCVWSSEVRATDALHVESWELKWISVREAPGPGASGHRRRGRPRAPRRDDGQRSAGRPAQAPRRAVPARGGCAGHVLGRAGRTPPRPAVAAAASSETVSEVRAFVYTVDESPALGCLAYTFVGGDDDPAVVATAVDLVGRNPVGLGVKAVNVLAWPDVPAEIRAALPDGFVIYRRKRPRRWRR
ncbi:hypothetical protein [Aeromicrobium sp. UC242_57]|uniref:hypothetical protein n=1 Tax=Aeromicrobium sp. UC242_57 TaxID=3374624 RepID=UPI0037ADDD58